MSIRRKIWSLPLALVTALMLVGLLGAVILAQATGAPTVTQVDDQDGTINADGFADTEQVDTNTAFGDTVEPVAIAFTAMTSDPKVAMVDFSEDDSISIVTVWWDALDDTTADEMVAENVDCRLKSERLGFSLTLDTTDDSIVNPDNAPVNLGATPPVTAARGLCQDYGALANLNIDSTTDVDEGAIAQLMVVQAFHWDMLTDAEMVAAATAGGLSNPSGYGARFAALNATQRKNIEDELYGKGVLARGVAGQLTFDNYGIDEEADSGTDGPDNPGEGAPGEATITWKASDAEGQLIPDETTVGQTFKFTASLTISGDIPTLVSGMFTPPADSDNSVTFVDAVTSGANQAPARVEVRVGPDATEIVDVTVTGLDLAPHNQKVNFSVSNGGSPFQIKKTELNAAEIVLGADESLDQSSYSFTLTVNEFENAPRNSEDLEMRVMVVVDNEPPKFVGPPPTELTVAERATGVELVDFDATDVNNQVLTFSLTPMIDGLEFDTATGVLKTDDDDGVDFDEPAEEDDPDTTQDETMPDNVHELTVSVTDGTETVTHDFTLKVTDSVEAARGIDLNFVVPEDQEGGEDNFFGAITLTDSDGNDATGNYVITEQIDGSGVRTAGPDSLFGIVDEGDTGRIHLKTAGSIDFEDSSISNNYTLAVMADGADADLVTIMIRDENEAPTFPDSYGAIETAEQDDDDFIGLYVLESAPVDGAVKIGKDAGGNPGTVDAQFVAEDQDSVATGKAIAYDLWYDDDLTDDDMELDDLYDGPDALVKVDSEGRILVNKELDTDQVGSIASVELVLRAFDPSEVPGVDEDGEAEEALLIGTIKIKVDVIDTNVAPVFDEQSQGQTHAILAEDILVGHEIYTYFATDEDGDLVKYRLRSEDDTGIFAIGELDGVLTLATLLDYETKTTHAVEVQAVDTDGDTDEVVLTVEVTNVNDEVPMFDSAPDTRINVAENTPRGTVLANYSASDADGDTVTYSLDGANKKSFMIDAATGDLMTLESLDYDSNTPCSLAGCSVTVIATDGVHNAKIGIAPNEAEPVVTIVVGPVEDSVSTLNVTKANPVPGTTRGDPMTALGNTKKSESPLVPERPGDLPNKDGAPLNFVETDWANWGTVLRIEVTAQSPDATCGSGNECVIISLNSDSADDTLLLKAYRMDTPAGAASNENKFVAAVMLVEVDGDATDIKDSAKNDIPVYKHGDGTVPRLQVDEEDEIEIEFYNLRGDIDVENEAPEISNFAPEHESAFDDPDVEYTFTVTDSHSGLPEPEDLPDPDGDDSYMPVVALISKGQCETVDHTEKARIAELIKDGRHQLVEDMANISDDASLYCPDVVQDGEYDASGAGYGFAPIRDDKDFDEIDDGFDVETTIVLRENRIFYVTFVACDNAGNCSFFDPDGNDDAAEVAEITVDTEDPVFVEARTGLTWDSTDNEYEDNRSYIQVIFNDLTKLNTETVEIDDFVVEGHSIKDVQVYENPDDDDVTWSDTRYGDAGSKNKRGIYRYRDLENAVFIELEDELLADETPDVTIVPNGVEDKAGNEQDDGDHEADDWISPAFTIVSIVSTRETSQDQVLAGDDDEVTVVVTSDERLDSTRPTVLVTYVNAPAGSVDTKGVRLCDTKAGDDEGTRERGEIFHTEDCADNDAATGGNLNNNVEKVSNTEWIVTITEPKATGYYNFRIEGNDRSPQENPGSEGVSPDKIVTKFFDADGDVNVDDAIFFEGDINLPKPQVRVSGVGVEDNEADVEFRSPLFVELDFAANHATCGANADTDERMSNCMNENSEYAEDNFDDIVVTSFVLDGVDITDSVKTTDSQSFLVSLESISIGDHTATVQAIDQAGNVFEDTLEIDFEVNDRDPFEKRLSPGWNLVSLPGEPADSSIGAVFGPGVEVRTVYSYDPVIPGGWMVAVRETLDSDWQGDLTEITGQHGYWVLSDAIQDWEVSIPRLAGGASGTGTPIQPPVIPMYAGWNLIPVTDVSGNALSAGVEISAHVYLNSLDDGLDLARVLGYDTIRNEWFTVLDMQMGSPGDLEIGSGYWVFVREAAALVPGGVAGVGGSGD